MTDLQNIQRQFNAAWLLYGDSIHPIVMHLTAIRDEIILNNIGGTKEQWAELANQYLNLIISSSMIGTDRLTKTYREKYHSIREKCK